MLKLRGAVHVEVVLAEALVARLALHERVAEGAQVAGGLPRAGGQDDAGVEADDVVASRHHELPPLALDVLLELHTERAVVPGRLRTAVDLTAGVDETSALREGDDVVQGGGSGLGHGAGPSGVGRSAGWLPARRNERSAYRAGVRLVEVGPLLDHLVGAGLVERVDHQRLDVHLALV